MKNTLLPLFFCCISLMTFAQSHRAANPIVLSDFVIEELKEQGDLAWFYPSNTPKTAQQFEKVELGIKLPKGVMDKIGLFLLGYGESAMGLNPFDRNDIDIEAAFIHDGKIVKRNDGFYYQEFRRDLGNNRWKDDTTSYAFRIRHAPEFTGDYQVDVTINIRGLAVFHVNTDFYVEASDNPGFLEQGAHNKHMRYSKTKESFVGVGQVIPWALYDDWYHTDEAAGPVNFMVMYNSFRKLNQAGGNFTRMVASPWFMQLEWEALGNYDPKMGQAWEFDRMNDRLQDLDIYFIFCALLHTPLESRTLEDKTETPGICWEAYCYNKTDRTPTQFASEEGLTCLKPVDFYGDSVALDHQKNYFRYFVARWGYSTSLAGWQLMSETDQTCEYADKVAEDGTIVDNSENRAKVNKWTDEITTFMRAECDDAHLKSISFISGKNHSSDMWDPSLYELDGISFVGLHDYVFETNPAMQRIRNRNLLKRYPSVNNLNVGLVNGSLEHPSYQKNMYIYDEFGHVASIPREYFPDGTSDPDPVVAYNSCADFSFKQDLWFTFSSGCAVAGLDWWNEHDPSRQKMWMRYFKGLNAFKKNIDFENVNYTRVREARGEIYIAQRWPLRQKDVERSNFSDYRNSDQLEAYIQIDSMGNQGFGWMMNRSFHRGNLLDSMPCISDMTKGEGAFSKPYLYSPPDDDVVSSPITIVEDDAYIRVYELKPRTDYTIDFYDTETGEVIKTVTEKSTFLGSLKIVSPEMKPSVRYDVAFKFYDSTLGWK